MAGGRKYIAQVKVSYYTNIVSNFKPVQNLWWPLEKINKSGMITRKTGILSIGAIFWYHEAISDIMNPVP